MRSQRCACGYQPTDILTILCDARRSSRARVMAEKPQHLVMPGGERRDDMPVQITTAQDAVGPSLWPYSQALTSLRQ